MNLTQEMSHLNKFFDWLRQSDYQGYIGAEYRPKDQSDQSFAWKENIFPMMSIHKLLLLKFEFSREKRYI